ncbi:MAG: peroxiredoxin [Spirochaetales bacterium]|nr:peroxiredoxin [Spirochaetales bacterium]MCF7938654.1 peroxiredoxin [Spirochaetales bacterium]
MENQGLPLLGDKFPELEVKTTHGPKSLPKDYKGKWFILFSHPGDFTPVCTTEFYSFAKMSDEFEKLNCKLIGLSVDQVFSHIKWVDWIDENLGQKIPFPVIADELGVVSKSLGMLHPGKGTNTVRAVFIVDPEGVMRLMMYYPQEIGRNMEEVLRSLKALQTSDGKGVACPANWPNNELLGDQVIIPPASDHESANERKGMENSYDWWFAYKKL